MSSRFGHYLMIGLFAGLVMFTNLGGSRLWDRDEPRNAGCAAEMFARGDWVVPVFNGELRTHKPVLLYWLIMSAYSLLGINEFAARLPSALLAVGTALCTYEIGRRLFTAKAGLWSGMVIATSLLFVLAGRAATPDSTLIFWSTLAIMLFVISSFPHSSHHAPRDVAKAHHAERDGHFGWIQAATIYGSLGFAVLAKGPVGLVLPVAVVGMFLLIVRRTPTVAANSPSWRNRLVSAARIFEPRHFLRTCWAMRPLTAIVVVAAVALPWYAWVGWRTDGEFLRGFFLEHNLSRAMQTMEGHRGNILFYPLAILVGFFPWSVFAVPLMIDSVAGVRRNDPWKHGFLLLFVWIGVYVVLFSLAKTKLPSYVTPCYPALALLTGAFLDRWLTGVAYVARTWHYAAFGVFTIVGLLMVIGVPLVAHQLVPGEEWLGLIGLVPFFAGLGCVWEMRRNNDRQAARGFAVAAAIWVVLLFGLGADRVDRHQRHDRLWAAVHAHSSQPRLAAFACLEPSWVFYGGYAIEELSHELVGPTHRPWIEVNGRWTPKGRVTIADLLSGPGDPLIITTGEQLGRVAELLPPDFQVLESVPFFLKDNRLVLLGRAEQQQAVAQRGDDKEARR